MSVKWLLTVYSQDILTRLDDTKARITSTYGSILKLDYTRKVTFFSRNKVFIKLSWHSFNQQVFKTFEIC